MTALPYTMRWVGVDSAPATHRSLWHLYFGEANCLCGLEVEDDDDIMASRLPSEMRGNAVKSQCPTCAEQYRKILYWKIEHGESLESLRT